MNKRRSSHEEIPVIDELDASKFIARRTGESPEITQLYIACRIRYQELNGEIEPSIDPSAERQEHSDILMLDGIESAALLVEYVHRITGISKARIMEMLAEEVFYRESRFLVERGSYMLIRPLADNFIASEEGKANNHSGTWGSIRRGNGEFRDH